MSEFTKYGLKHKKEHLTDDPLRLECVPLQIYDKGWRLNSLIIDQLHSIACIQLSLCELNKVVE